MLPDALRPGFVVLKKFNQTPHAHLSLAENNRRYFASTFGKGSDAWPNA